MKISSVYAAIATLVFASTGFAQSTTPKQVETAIAIPDMMWSYNELVQVNTFKSGGDTMVGLNQTLSLDLAKNLNLDMSLPLYNQGSHTSVGDLDLGGSLGVIDGNNSVIGKWDLSVGGGVYIPVGSEYFRSANVNPFINTKFDCKAWVLDFTQTAEFRFIGGDAYTTWLGGNTNSDFLTLGSDLSYKWNEISLGGALDQVYYVNAGEAQLFLGPTAKWQITNSIDLGASVLVPVYQNVSTPEANVFFTAGLSIKF